MATQYNTTTDQEMLALLGQKMTELHGIVASMGADIVSYTDTELAALKAQLQAMDPDGVVEAVAKITAFLEANDADGNNVIDALPGLISDLAALTARVTALETDNTSNKARITAVEGVQTQHGNAISGLQGDVTNHAGRIAALEALEDDAGLTEQEVENIAVAQDRILLGAISNAMNVAFASIDLGKTYPITGAPAGDTGGIA